MTHEHLRKVVRLVIPRFARRGIKATAGYFLGSRRYATLRSPSAYFRPEPVIGYIGWLGHGNLGDEAMFEAARSLFPAASVLRYPVDQRVELTLHRAFRSAKKMPEVVVLGGGTMLLAHFYLPPVEHALQRNIPFYVFGSGAVDPSFAGDAVTVGSDQYLDRWRQVLASARRVLVRGPKSVEILREVGVENAEPIGDLALALVDDQPVATTPTGHIGVNLGPTERIRGDAEHIRRTVIEFIRGWQSTTSTITYLPCDEQDELIGDGLSRELGDGAMNIWRRYTNTQETLELIRSFDVLVSQRLHGVILAAVVGTPPVSLSYRPKHDDFLQSIGLEQQSIRTDRITPELLSQLVRATLENRVTLGRQAKEASLRWRDVQRTAASTIFGHCT